MKKSHVEVLVFLLIVATAIFFRFYQLNQSPPGLYPDEAMDGTNALVANMTGHYQIFYTDNNGRQGLFINLQALSVKFSGIHDWALRDVSGIFGVLAVIGLYLLGKELFDDWRIGALASFLLAVSFWHVNLSRIGFDAIMVPFILVFLFYFLWRGLKRNLLIDFFWAGVFSGLGFYTYISYRVAPLIALILFVNYWWYLKKDFGHPKYEYTRNRLLAGFSLFVITTFFVALPIGIYFLRNPDQFIARSSEVSALAQAQPLHTLAASTIQTLGMFNFAGDMNQRQNFFGAPMLPWMIGIFFLIGFFREFWHWIRRKHGHLSPLHTLMFSWFFIMLLPGFLSTEAPHALRTIGVLPIVMIFTARGLWWVFESLGTWYDEHYPLQQYHERHMESPFAVWVLIIFLIAFGFYEYNRYFNIWAHSPVTAAAFNQNYSDIAAAINALPLATPKYVIVTAPGVIAGGLPVPVQPVMFLTDTPTAALQKAKNIHYLLPDQVSSTHFPPNAKIFTIN